MLVSQRFINNVEAPSNTTTVPENSYKKLEKDGIKPMKDDRMEALLAVVDENSGCYAPILINSKADDNSLWERPLGYGAFGVVWSVFDPRTRKKAALKRIPNVFHNTVTAKRVYRELYILSHVIHDNIISMADIVKSDNAFVNDEIYILCDFMQTDLHKIIVSPQPLSIDHVKIFLYQILRGVKYLHSANIIHRDIKPGNMLVNSNCLLKICDFGLARIEDECNSRPLTQEVVTQYYRAPELLMESGHYSFSVDLWSVGCTFAELLCRKILFQAKGPLEQLDLILNIVGTPSLTDLQHSHPDARYYVLSKRKRKPNLGVICKWSNNVTEESLNLLESMLRFNPDNRISAEEALSNSYLDDARLRYHSCMCTCCHDSTSPVLPNSCAHCTTHHNHHSSSLSSSASSTPPSTSSAHIYHSHSSNSHHIPHTHSSTTNNPPTTTNNTTTSMSNNNPVRHFCQDSEPICHKPISSTIDNSFSKMTEAKETIKKFIRNFYQSDQYRLRLVLNPNSKNYQPFVTSNVAQAKDNGSIHKW